MTDGRPCGKGDGHTGGHMSAEALRAAHARYDASEKGLTRHARYDASEKGWARTARYSRTAKRMLADVRSNAKRRGNQ
jgi:hypothetical protein